MISPVKRRQPILPDHVMAVTRSNQVRPAVTRILSEASVNGCAYTGPERQSKSALVSVLKRRHLSLYSQGQHLQPSEIGQRILERLSIQGPEIQHWIDDMISIARIVAAISKSGTACFNLQGGQCVELVNPATARCHIDQISLGAVVTYCGPTTEFFDNNDVGERVGYETAHLVNGARAHRLLLGEILFLRGEGKFPKSGLAHRSPHPKGEKAKRSYRIRLHVYNC